MELVQSALNEPDVVTEGYDRRKVYMKKYTDQILQQGMLLRIITEETSTEITVVTVYKTSKFDKYLKGPK